MKFGRVFSAAAMVMAASITMVGCGGGNSPSAAVKGWFDAMNAGKHAEALSYCSGAFAEAAKMDGGKSMSDDFTKVGTMTKLEIMSEETRGEGATVKARVHFKDGSTEDHDLSLVQQDGKWKISF